MDWYYAEGKEKRGPFTEAQIRPLVTAGKITPDTLVWATGMTNWKPARETPLSILISSHALPPDHHTCIITGKSFHESQMIKTSHGWVSAEGKDRYYQSLREGVAPSTAEGLANARRDGKRLVVPVLGAKLPSRCVKTNATLTDAELAASAKERTLYWCTPWAALSILLNLLVYLVLYLILRKKVKLAIPLSDTGRGIINRHRLIAWLSAFIGVGLIIYGFANIDTLGHLILIAFLPLLFALIYGNTMGAVLRPTKLKNGYVWFAGACPEYLAELPPY